MSEYVVIGGYKRRFYRLRPFTKGRSLFSFIWKTFWINGILHEKYFHEKDQEKERKTSDV